MAVVLLFKFIIYKRRLAWWRNYNSIPTSALEFAVTITTIIGYFTIYYTVASESYVSSVLLSCLGTTEGIFTNEKWYQSTNKFMVEHVS